MGEHGGLNISKDKPMDEMIGKLINMWSPLNIMGMLSLLAMA
jgi:hypothetical protein